MTAFVLITAAREEPKSSISAVIATYELQKLYLLAHTLRDEDMTWTAKAHSGAGHRSESTPS